MRTRGQQRGPTHLHNQHASPVCPQVETGYSRTNRLTSIYTDIRHRVRPARFLRRDPPPATATGKLVWDMRTHNGNNITSLLRQRGKQSSLVAPPALARSTKAGCYSARRRSWRSSNKTPPLSRKHKLHCIPLHVLLHLPLHLLLHLHLSKISRARSPYNGRTDILLICRQLTS